jgi:hypothetical protein
VRYTLEVEALQQGTENVQEIKNWFGSMWGGHASTSPVDKVGGLVISATTAAVTTSSSAKDNGL